jgi:hypothetical protein
MLTREVILTKDEQVRDYVFCSECEERFNKNGESWVLANCYREGHGFALMDKLGTAPLIYSEPTGFRVYSTAGNLEIDADKLSYFAASVIWRASVHRWRILRRYLRAPSLGPEYEEKFRQYLLGLAPFPHQATLKLVILTGSHRQGSFYFPYGGRERIYHSGSDRNCQRIEFQYFGLGFCLFIGKVMPPELRDYCLVHSPDRCITFSEAAEAVITHRIIRMVAEAEKVGAMKK